MKKYPKSEAILTSNRRYIPGGVVSINRSVSPEIVFVRGEGPLIWDAEGNEYVDYHAAFAPHFLGHNDPDVTHAVERVLRDGASLFGSGTTVLEGRLAELICTNVSFVDTVQFLNTGSEATYQAIRVARAATGRDHVICTQGGYNGWHNDVSCNVMTPLSALGRRVSPGEYPYVSMSAGVPKDHQKLVHPVNFNDLASVEWVCQQYPIAAMITEPILQNVGVIHPHAGYLEGLRALADKYGFVLIIDEVKTGFRHALGGYCTQVGLRPDLVVYGKAMANGYPIAALGGRRDLMNLFADSDPARRVLLAGTYNAHPVPTAAAIATIEKLMGNDGEVYTHTESMGARMQDGLEKMLAARGIQGKVARQGSAFCLYFMDHLPVDWHDVASNHNAATDEAMRRDLIERGVYVFPLWTKQCSISYAHQEKQIDFTLEAMDQALATVETLCSAGTNA
ncbi:MAG: aspartate aminotransferase family protein [Bryobacteraceae bacterium]